MSLPSCRKPREEADDAPAATRSSSRPRGEDAPEPAQDPRTALLEAASIENPAERNKAVAAIANRVLAEDPALAREAFNMLTADAVAERGPLIRHIAMQLAGEDPEAALAWADGLANEKETAAARSRIALVVADADPRKAATILAETDDAGREMEVAIVQVLQHWSADEPAAAAEWLAMFPAADFRKAGMQTVMSRWFAADAAAAMAWLGSLEGGEIRDEAIQAAAGVLSGQSQEKRALWLEAADPKVRAALEGAP